MDPKRNSELSSIRSTKNVPDKAQPSKKACTNTCLKPSPDKTDTSPRPKPYINSLDVDSPYHPKRSPDKTPLTPVTTMNRVPTTGRTTTTPPVLNNTLPVCDEAFDQLMQAVNNLIMASIPTRCTTDIPPSQIHLNNNTSSHPTDYNRFIPIRSTLRIKTPMT